MERQKRVIGRDNPPSAWFVIDELSLYREVGSAQAMAAQLHRLLQVAAMPTITIPARFSSAPKRGKRSRRH
jgi:uncharacterized protein DUF5753